MKKITKLFAFTFLIFFASSCKNEKSLQSYLVNTSSKEGFYTGDLPISSVLSAKADVPDDIKETIKSIKKINFTFLPKTTDNTAAYEAEKKKLKNIFTGNDSYKNLIVMKTKDMNAKLFYTGTTDAVDEIIIFGYGKKVGVGVARLLGKNMNPAKIVEMVNNANMNKNSNAIEKFAKMFSKN